MFFKSQQNISVKYQLIDSINILYDIKKTFRIEYINKKNIPDPGHNLLNILVVLKT